MRRLDFLKTLGCLAFVELAQELCLASDEPRNLVISLFVDADPKKKIFDAAAKATLDKMGKTSVQSIYPHPGSDIKLAIIDAIMTHVKNFGTLDNLLITSHGKTNSISSEIECINSSDMINMIKINTIDLLSCLLTLQQEIGPVAKTIIFDACNMFSSLNDEQIGYYKGMACQLNSNIVASFSKVSSTYIDFGLFVVVSPDHGYFVTFTPEGNVKRDRLYNPQGYQDDCAPDNACESPFALAKARTWINRAKSIPPSVYTP